MEPSNLPEDNDRPYEPPRVESVISAEELAREVQYAGAVTPSADSLNF